MNKRGDLIGSWIVTIVVLFLLLLVFLIFFVIFEVSKSRVENEITTKVQENQIEINLLNFLRTPINEKENVADYIGYAMLEETDKEKGKKKLIYEVPTSYSQALDLFNKNLLEFYKPDCVSLKLDFINPSGEILRTRYLGFCDVQDYSASIIVPLKDSGNLINITMITGKAAAPRQLKWCLRQVQVLSFTKWECSASYHFCQCVEFAELSDCQEKAEEINNRPDYDKLTCEDIKGGLIDIEKEEFWALCENSISNYRYECACIKTTNKFNPCEGYDRQIGKKEYVSKEECENGAIEFKKESEINNEDPPHCSNAENMGKSFYVEIG